MHKCHILVALAKICLISAASTNYCQSVNDDCMVFSQCAEAKKLVTENPFDPEVIRLLDSSSCGNSVKQDCILCSKIKVKTNSTIIEKHVTTEDKINPMDFLPEDCGLSAATERIYNGERTGLEEYPWIALLKYRNKPKGMCHGALISNRYVVTVRHCLQDDNGIKHDVEFVVLGEYDTNTTEDCLDVDYCADPVQVFSVEKSRVFARAKDRYNDIAIIRLNGTAKKSSFVKPICLPFNFSSLETNETLKIAGWGITENEMASNLKLKASLNALTRDECGRRTFLVPDASQLCAGSIKGQDSCKGDSGGPLMVERVYNREGKTFLAGLVSLGSTCGSTAAIYTNIFIFRDWILEMIKSMEMSKN